MRLPVLALALFTASAFAAPPVDSEAPAEQPAKSGGKKAHEVKIEMRDGLRFDPPRFSAQPGEEVVISLENADSTHQPHNFLILQPGKRDEVVQQALALGEKGPGVEYIPNNPAILVHSSLLNGEATNKVKFTAPTEKGVYPYVCTMPGHGMVMYGAMYIGEKMPALAKDKNIPTQAAQAAVPGNGERPFVQREFLPDTGPASIAVALPGEQNYCWDAAECRLRYAWPGAFIDASANWKGNGNELAVLPNEPWWRAAQDAFPLNLGVSDSPQPVKFLGYKLEDGVPEFHYRVGTTEVFEKITALPDSSGITEHFRIPKQKKPVKFSVAPGDAAVSSAGAASQNGVVTPANPADFSITLSSSASPAPAK